MSIGKRIKRRRKELKMSADELGARLGKDRSTVYRYENGDIEKFPVDILYPIAEALNVSVAYLMGWEEEQKKNDTQADIILKMRSDNDFLSVVEKLSKDEEFLSLVKALCKLEPSKLASIKNLID